MNHVAMNPNKPYCSEQELPFFGEIEPFYTFYIGASTLLIDSEKDTIYLEDQHEIINDSSESTTYSFTVPLELEYHGFRYTQVCRGVRSCVYQQTLEEKTIAFEVFIIRIQPEAILGGKMIPAHERFPKDEDFGKTAWTYFTLEQAKEKYYELEKSYVSKLIEAPPTNPDLQSVPK